MTAIAPPVDASLDLGCHPRYTLVITKLEPIRTRCEDSLAWSNSETDRFVPMAVPARHRLESFDATPSTKGVFQPIRKEGLRFIFVLGLSGILRHYRLSCLLLNFSRRFVMSCIWSAFWLRGDLQRLFCAAVADGQVLPTHATQHDVCCDFSCD